jgi:hypothetical protein
VNVPLEPTQSRGDGIPELIADVRAIVEGKVFFLEGFDKYPDISDRNSHWHSACGFRGGYVREILGAYYVHVMLFHGTFDCCSAR